jgi:hypothetical protein
VETIDYRCEDGPTSFSGVCGCVTVSSPDSLSSSETTVDSAAWNLKAPIAQILAVLDGRTPFVVSISKGSDIMKPYPTWLRI